MADLLKIRATNGNGLIWNFVDRSMAGKYKIHLDQVPTEKINDGDVWHVILVDKKKADKGSRQEIAIVKLIARVSKLEPWQKIKELPDYYTDPTDLECALIWLNSGTDIILMGPKGTGKTAFPFAISKALKWQDPCKVDVYTIKRTTDLFGTDAASNGSTHFVRSSLLDYIERATISLEKGLDSHFILLLDEINRVHAKVNESLHGLFDDTRQVTIPTAEGSKTIRLPSNFHTIGTMNTGANYLGTHGLDEALKDRFAPLTLKGMPLDYEVNKLVLETKVGEKEAFHIVQIATLLRESSQSGQLSSSLSYRGCRNTARLVSHGVHMRTAIIKGLLGWYEGDLTINNGGEVVEPNSEKAKAFSALRAKGIINARDLK